MPYRVMIDGTEVVCDTAEEAAQLARSVSNGAGSPIRVPPVQVPRVIVPPARRPVVVPPSTPPPPAAFATLTAEHVRELHRTVRGTNQDRLIRLLSEKEWVSDKELREAVGFDTNNALAGVTAALTKNAWSVGIRVPLLVKKVGLVGTEAGYHYALKEQFKALLKEAGWIK